MDKILIAGGSGFIGKALTDQIMKTGKYKVGILSRKHNPRPGYIQWNPAKRFIESDNLQQYSTIINLAGENLGGGFWTKKRKNNIIKSRIDALNAIYDNISAFKGSLKTLVSASAVGYYGDRADALLFEDNESGKGFLAEVCNEWEEAANQFSEVGIRTIILRIGFVIGKKGGGLGKLLLPAKLYMGMPMGDGRQHISWIHIDDLCELILFSVNTTVINGTFNAVASNPVRNVELLRQACRVLKRPFWNIHPPEWLIKTLLGDMSETILYSQNVSNQKILTAGFRFKFNSINQALENAIG